MKLDTRALRHLTSDDWRVLTAVEIQSKHYELVPTPLIDRYASRLIGAHDVRRSISNLAKIGLIKRMKNAKYDGYRLTYGGLDYLSLHTLARTSTLYSTGPRIGVGKESDIYVAAAPAPADPTSSDSSHPITTSQKLALKIHRLGRISFRSVRLNRDYANGKGAGKRHGAGGGAPGGTGGWMHLSRLAALKEYTCLRVLHANGFPVPQPVRCERHCVVMQLMENSVPLRQVSKDELEHPAKLYAELMAIAVRLADVGLIHGDYNEFNILIEMVEEEVEDQRKDEGQGTGRKKKMTRARPIIIDFPQMISTSHPNATAYFDRDVACIKRFFERRFGFTSDEPGPFLEDVLAWRSRRAAGLSSTSSSSPTSSRGQGGDQAQIKRLDIEVEASGFSRKMAGELERYVESQHRQSGDGGDNGDEMVATYSSDEEEDDDNDEEGHDEKKSGREGTQQQNKDSWRSKALSNQMEVLQICHGSNSTMSGHQEGEGRGRASLNEKGGVSTAVAAAATTVPVHSTFPGSRAPSVAGSGHGGGLATKSKEWSI